MKRSELRRTTRLQANPAKPLRRTVKIRAKNPKRRASEFARCYGSRARVAFVKALPCLVCGKGPSDNAHTETDGAGRKAHHTRIIPLCRTHHQHYDERRGEFRDADVRDLLALHAPRIEQLWQDHLTRSGRTAA